MLTQSRDVLTCLRDDLAAERLVLGVGSAGGQEVLPDEETELVAE